MWSTARPGAAATKRKSWGEPFPGSGGPPPKRESTNRTAGEEISGVAYLPCSLVVSQSSIGWVARAEEVWWLLRSSSCSTGRRASGRGSPGRGITRSLLPTTRQVRPAQDRSRSSVVMNDVRSDQLWPSSDAETAVRRSARPRKTPWVKASTIAGGGAGVQCSPSWESQPLVTKTPLPNTTPSSASAPGGEPPGGTTPGHRATSSQIVACSVQVLPSLEDSQETFPTIT